MALRNKAFHQLRQLFQQHTARWQHELPDLTKPQYAVMRAIADKPGIEQVALIEAKGATLCLADCRRRKGTCCGDTDWRQCG